MSRSSDEKQKQTRRIGLGLLAVQVIAATIALGIRIQVGGFHPSGHARVSLVFAMFIAAVDWIWLIYYLQQPSRKTTLTRIQTVIAWFIYQTAAIPFLLLAERAVLVRVRTYSMIQIALLVMGLIPVASMIWLDNYLRRKFN